MFLNNKSLPIHKGVSLLVWQSVKISLAEYFKLRVTFRAWHDGWIVMKIFLPFWQWHLCRPTLACYYAPNCIFKLFKIKIGYFCTCCNQLKENSLIGPLITSVSVIASKPQSRSCIMKKCIWLRSCISVVGKSYNCGQINGHRSSEHWSSSSGT